MARKKTTLSVDEELLRATKIYAARTGKREYQVVEEALQRYLGFDVLDEIWRTADMDPDEADRIGAQEVRGHRRERATGDAREREGAQVQRPARSRRAKRNQR